MSRCQQVARPIALCLRPAISSTASATTARLFSNSAARREVETTTTPSTPSDAVADLLNAGSPKKPAAEEPVEAGPVSKKALRAQWLDPNTTTLFWAEKKLQRDGIKLVGSRRRRAAVRQTPDLTFEQLPYHAFQEARKLLAEDREEKLEAVERAYQKLKTAEAMPADKYRGGKLYKNKRLHSLRKRLEYLKIQADSNDPAVKRKFEDGYGDMSKPIYRHFAEERWRSMSYKILAQRLEQFKIVPDVVPEFDPKMDVQLSFNGFKVQAGEKVYSVVSERPPNLRVQVFDDKKRLVSVVVMDSDVPDPETDSFGRRLHFLAANIPLDCLTKNISLNQITALEKEKLAVPWFPPYSQEGAPYHRLSIWIMEQRDGKRLNVKALAEAYKEKRDGFDMREFRSRTRAQPYGFSMFRSEWDEGTAAVMKRHNIPGSEIVFRRARVRSLRPPKKARGWEAKRQGPGFRHLWKYTKRIAKSSGGR